MDPDTPAADRRLVNRADGTAGAGTATHAEEVTVTVCPGGPLLVRGPMTLLDADGAALDPGRRTVALCRCGRSAEAPFCDGSHKRRTRRPPVDAVPAPS